MVAGHLQKKNGKYYMVLSYIGGAGKRKTKWLATGLPVKGNKRRAEQMLMEMRKSFVPDETPISGEILFADFMRQWLEINKRSIATTTYAGYMAMLNSRIDPYFRKTKVTLHAIRATDIQRFYMDALKNTKATTIIHYHGVLRKALQYAVKNDLIPTNPADKIERPKKEPFMAGFYDSEEIEKLFEAAKGTALEIPIFLGAFYGMRRSEVIGLRWRDIDFQRNTISVQHTVTSCTLNGERTLLKQDTTKSKSSRRTLPLIPAFKEKLLEVQQKQGEYKRLCGRCYDRRYLEYVCVDQMGVLMRPDYLTQTFPVFLKKHGLRRIRFHDLRHSCASLLLANGVPMKQIQEWLGHSDFSTTANIYAHLEFESKISSAEAMASGLKGAIEAIS